MAKKSAKVESAPVGASRGEVPILWRVTRGGKMLFPVDKAREGDAVAARDLFGRLGHALEQGMLSDDAATLLADALRMIYRGAPVERAFMKSPHARVKSGVKAGSVRKGDADIRRRALGLLREMRPKTDADVSTGIKKIARRAGCDSKTIRADIIKQLKREAETPAWPAPTVPRLTYDELREKYPDMGHGFWKWAALGDDGHVVEIN